MFLVRQGERNRVHSQNPVVAGLRDPKNPLSARDVIERSQQTSRVEAAWTVRTFPLCLLQYYVETVLCL